MTYRLNVRSVPQTFFVTFVTADRIRLLQSDRNASLMRKIVLHYRDQGRYALHPFVIMPDHIHLLITPGPAQSLERCVQCMKGGFSHSLRQQARYSGQIWQRSFHEHRIRDVDDYRRHCDYIARNPATAGYQFLELEGPALDPMPNFLGG